MAHKSLPKPLKRHQADAIRAAIPALNPRDQALLTAMLDCGLRVSEACALHRNHIDATELALTVRGKGAQDRVVYTGPQTAHILTPPPHTDWCCWNLRDPINHIHIRNAELICDRLGKQLEIRLWPHRLRHTYAVEMLRAGLDLRSLQLQLGHASLETTEIYLQIADDARRSSVRQALRSRAGVQTTLRLLEDDASA